MSKSTQIAQDLIEKYSLKPGFDIKALIKKLDIELEESSLESMSGFAYQKEGRKVIGIEKTDGDARKRFTIAHELGHMLVHANKSVQFDKKYDFVYFRDDNSSTGLNPKEVEANAFAAELLMPADTLREKISKLKGVDLIDDDEKIQRLAKDFKVSVTAMSVRIGSLTSLPSQNLNF